MIDTTSDDDPVTKQLLQELFREPSLERKSVIAATLGRHWGDRAMERIKVALDRDLPVGSSTPINWNAKAFTPITWDTNLGRIPKRAGTRIRVLAMNGFGSQFTHATESIATVIELHGHYVLSTDGTVDGAFSLQLVVAWRE